MTTCPSCGSQVAPRILACPGCGSLVHGAEVERLVSDARDSSDPGAALATLRRAAELLPPGSSQHSWVIARIDERSRQLDSAPAGAARPAPQAPATGGRTAARGGAIGAIALLLWKLKALVLLALTKGKLLLLGLSKGSTMFTMLLSFGVYWAAFGWRLAAGLVVSIYVHEMGHVVALQRLGIAATAPMFLPGVGAVVRLKQYPQTPREDARVGLAGPIWGMGAAAACMAAFLATGSPVWAAIAHVGAWINIFNLLPVWQLDGARGLHALSRGQRLMVAVAAGGLYLLTREGLLLFIAAITAFRALSERGAEEPDPIAMVQFVTLLGVLSTFMWIRVPGL